jgi:hypothetical protein
VWLVGCGARVSDSIASMSSGAPRHLFIAGCPRSGTSALAFLLNEHPQLVLGFERFKRVRAQLDPFHFTPAQFFSPVAAETDIRGELLYERLRARWERGSVTAIGDKVPLYTRVLPQLLERFPDGRMVVMVREPVDVAASFRRRAADPQDWWPAGNDHRLAVAMWTEALAARSAGWMSCWHSSDCRQPHGCAPSTGASRLGGMLAAGDDRGSRSYSMDTWRPTATPSCKPGHTSA